VSAVKGGYSLLSNFSYALLILERHEISGPNKQTNKQNPTSSKEISNSLVISSLKISVINDDN